MKTVPDGMIEGCAVAFAGPARPLKGMAASEIVDYFRRYNPMVAGLDTYNANPTRRELFKDTLRQLAPEDQWRALAMLCKSPPKMKYAIPDDETRSRLYQTLFQGRANRPIGVVLSTIDIPDIHKSWWKIVGRLDDSVGGSITAARTMLEEVCKRVLSERNDNHSDTAKGDVGKLMKAVCSELSLSDSKRQVVSGVVTIVNAVASMSNAAGDRHGIIDGAQPDGFDAELVANLCGSLVVWLTRIHQETEIENGA